MKAPRSLRNLLKLSLLLGTWFSLQAYDFQSEDFDDSFDEWLPDVTNPHEFGSGLGNERLFSFDPPATPKKDEALLISDAEPAKSSTAGPEEITQDEAPPRTILINFNNVAITEFIRFISRITGKNFVYDESELQFNVTIVSDEPATLENVMAALLQILRIHNLNLIEQGNSIIIHSNPKVNSISKVVAEGQLQLDPQSADIVTQVFRLNTLDTERAVRLIKPLISEGAIVDQIPDASNIVVTDIAVNVQKIGQLLKSLDSPASGLILGQYLVLSSLMDSLIPLVEKIMEPIAEGKPIVFVPHAASNSIFIVSTPFLVERAIAVMRNLDINTGATRIFTDENLRFAQGALSGAGGYGGAGGAGAGGAGAGAGSRCRGSRRRCGWRRRQPLIHTRRSRRPWGRPGGPGAPGCGTPAGEGGISGFQNGLGPGALSTQSQIEYLRRQQGFTPGSIGAGPSWTDTLPVGHIQRTQFYIQKLRFRNGSQIAEALQRIAESLQRSGASNSDLVSTIQSIQSIEASNSLVFTGYPKPYPKLENSSPRLTRP